MMKVPVKAMSEDKLIAAIKIKSREGAEALYAMYSKTLFGIIARIVNNQEMAEDICQDTFVRIWESFDKYDASKGRLFTWMSRVARNIALDTLRSKQHHKHLITMPLEAHAAMIEEHDHFVLNTDTLGVNLWTENLSKNQKDVINLIYFKGYTHTEVADKLGMPLGTVKTHCRKGITVLRSIYDDMNAVEIKAGVLN